MPRQADLKLIDVVVGVVSDADDKILIQQRTDGPFAGQWEFPGGKREPGEASFDALRRELHEENGIEVVRASPLIHITHQYPDRVVSLRTFFVDHYRGGASGVEGQQIRWVSRRELFGQDMLAADRPLAVAINLPHQYLITPSVRDEGEVPKFVDTLTQTLAGSPRMLCLRAPELTDDSYARLARLVAAHCRSAGCELLLHGGATRASLVSEVGAHGLHVSGTMACHLDTRPVETDQWFCVTARSAEDLSHASAMGADFAALAWVPDSSSCDASGWPEFCAATRDATLPVYALGELRLADMAQARAQGGQGVAVTPALWGD